MDDKFMMIDATDIIIIGGFGNLEGNLGLLKYNKEDIRKMIIENNDGNDNIRLINSLLQSLKELQEQLRQKEDVISKAKELIQLKIIRYKNELDYMLSEYDLKEILEILDNKGSDNNGEN